LITSDNLALTIDVEFPSVLFTPLASLLVNCSAQQQLTSILKHQKMCLMGQCKEMFDPLNSSSLPAS
jgi:hypothetical protein